MVFQRGRITRDGFIGRPHFTFISSKIQCPNCGKYTNFQIELIQDGDKHICSHCWKNIKITLTSEKESNFDRGYSGPGRGD